jgi:hypothetical protein
LILEPLAAVASLFALRLDRSNRVGFFLDTGRVGCPWLRSQLSLNAIKQSQ